MPITPNPTNSHPMLIHRYFKRTPLSVLYKAYQDRVLALSKSATQTDVSVKSCIHIAQKVTSRRCVWKGAVARFGCLGVAPFRKTTRR